MSSYYTFSDIYMGTVSFCDVQVAGLTLIADKFGSPLFSQMDKIILNLTSSVKFAKISSRKHLQEYGIA